MEKVLRQRQKSMKKTICITKKYENTLLKTCVTSLIYFCHVYGTIKITVLKFFVRWYKQIREIPLNHSNLANFSLFKWYNDVPMQWFEKMIVQRRFLLSFQSTPMMENNKVSTSHSRITEFRSCSIKYQCIKLSWFQKAHQHIF